MNVPIVNKNYKIKLNCVNDVNRMPVIETVKVLAVSSLHIVCISLSDIKYLKIPLTDDDIRYDDFNKIYYGKDDEAYFIKITKRDDILYAFNGEEEVEFIEPIMPSDDIDYVECCATCYALDYEQWRRLVELSKTVPEIKNILKSK